MYLQHFGLRDKPFRVVPSPRFLFASETHDESRARVLYGIRESRGFVVVTGGIGLGKTTVLLSVLDQLESTVRCALIFNPVDTFAQLLKMICFEFGMKVDTQDETELMQQLNLFLVDRLAVGETCVLLIDEAQNLSVELLEKVRTLSNLQTEDASLLQVVLVGQPELMQRLDDPRLVQLRQRVGVWHEITPLDGEETRSYVWHRLRLAGAAMPERLIDDRSCLRVSTRTGGVPRLINQLCDTALVIAYGKNAETVGVEHIDEAAQELHLDRSVELGQQAQPPSSTAAPTRQHHRRWAWAAAMILVLAALGWGASRYWPEDGVGPLLSGWGSARTPVEAPVPESTETTPPVVAGVPAVDPQVLAARASRAREVAAWRRDDRTLYAVHLASFRDETNARDFASQILADHPDWVEPFFVDESGNESRWFRVLSGGFRDRNQVRDWIEVLKDERGLAYAQATRLDAHARPLPPAADGGPGESR